MNVTKLMGIVCATLAMAGATGCASEPEVGDESGVLEEQIVANSSDSSWQYRSLVRLLQSGGLSERTVERYIEPTTGMYILHNPGALPAVNHVALNARGQRESDDQLPFNILRSLLEGGVRTDSPRDIAEPPRAACHLENNVDLDPNYELPYVAWDSAAAAADENYQGGEIVDGNAIYITRVTSYDQVSHIISNLPDWLGGALNESERAAADESAQRARAVESKVLYSVSIPARDIVLHFGLGDYRNSRGETVQVWRIYVANVITPCSA